MEQKKRFSEIINDVVGSEGIKSEVIITLTPETTTKIALLLIALGVSIGLTWHLMKNMVKNKQLLSIEGKILELQNFVK